ncbi:MAG TPA: ABC transporter permease, partial [Clostridia bacterium]|nr:ABC transporter permease [Clostridia bacterium]
MNRRIKNTLITLAFPVLMFLIMEAVCLIAAGRHVIDFSTNLDLVNLVRNTGIACAITYALSFNLTSGRLDLSLGAQRLAGTVIGSNIALALGLSGVWLLLFSLTFGLVFGLVVGLVFVWARVPPMVLGIGMGLI